MPSTDIAAAVQIRAGELVPGSFNAEDNSVEVVWTTGARGTRYDWVRDTVYEEELDLAPASVDMSRFDAGVLQVLDSHDTYSGVRSILGIATRGWLKSGEGRATIKLSQDPSKAGVVADIRAGIIRAISVGYRVMKYAVTAAADRGDGGTVPLYRAVSWQPHELSFVSVPFDMAASTRAAGDGPPGLQFAEGHPQHIPATHRAALGAPQPKATTMTPEEIRARAADITDLCTRHGVPNLAVQHLRAGSTLEVVQRAILEERARMDAAAGGHLNVRGQQHGNVDRAELVTAALAARMGVGTVDRSNPYRGAALADMVRDLLEARNVSTSGMTARDLFGGTRSAGMMTTSDFPNLLAGAGQRVLAAAYQAAPSGIKPIARKSTAKDFRAKMRMQLSEAPDLLLVNEHGEFPYGALDEAVSSYKLLTYGRIVAITRQALVNDDLDAFGDLTVRMARQAAELEAKTLLAQLTGNPVMGDGVALFHANHGNLAVGAGSALQLSSLQAARLAMRLQKGLDKSTPINAQAKFLVVPAALESVARQLTSTAYTPTAQTGINDMAGQLEVLVEPRLDAISATAWYLASDSSQIDTVEYSYLEGEEGPQVFVKDGWTVDGTEFKVREDFGAGVLDWRGLYKANGA